MLHLNLEIFMREFNDVYTKPENQLKTFLSELFSVQKDILSQNWKRNFVERYCLRNNLQFKLEANIFFKYKSHTHVKLKNKKKLMLFYVNFSHF